MVTSGLLQISWRFLDYIVIHIPKEKISPKVNVWQWLSERNDCMGRILVIEFDGNDTEAFDDVMTLLSHYPGFEHLHFKTESAICLPGIEIYPDKRKIYRDRREIHLTVKEYDLLCLLVANKGRVLTYEQIYQRIWGEDPMGNENNAVGCHIRNLREKLYEASPEAPFTIRCVREVGYTFEITEGSAEA